MVRRAGSAAVLVAAAITVAAPLSVAGQVAYATCFGSLVVAAWRGVRRERAGGRLPGAMVAAAVTAWLAGDLVYTTMELAGVSSDVGPPDAFWLAGYPLMGTGLFAMVRRRAPGQWRAGLQDGLTLTTAAALSAWIFLVQPTLSGAGGPALAVVAALYPLGDLVLLSSVLFLVLSPGRSGTPTRLLVTGAGATLVLDLAFAIVPNVWPDLLVERLDGLLLVANAMIVGAVLHRERGELVTPVRVTVESLHPARVLFLGLALLTAPVMAVIHSGLVADEQIVLVGGCVVTVAFTLARFTGAVREQSRVQRVLAHLADHDALTGLPNRRVLTDRLDREFTPAEETVILYVDLDGFKAVNDEYGHAAGDTVLVEVARRVRASIRRDDLPVRLGGDEFAVLCPGLGTAAGHALAERLVAVVAEPIPFGAHQLRVGASVGMSSALGCGSGDELISRADHAMLDAKRAGRGRAMVAA